MCKFTSEIQFLIGRRPVRSYSPGALATIVQWKSAPMDKSTQSESESESESVIGGLVLNCRLICCIRILVV